MTCTFRGTLCSMGRPNITELSWVNTILQELVHDGPELVELLNLRSLEGEGRRGCRDYSMDSLSHSRLSTSKTSRLENYKAFEQPYTKAWTKSGRAPRQPVTGLGVGSTILRNRSSPPGRCGRKCFHRSLFLPVKG